MRGAFLLLAAGYWLLATSVLSADNFTLSGNYSWSLNYATETKTWNITQTPTNPPMEKGVVSTLTTNGALVDFGEVVSPSYAWFKILSTNSAYFLRIGAIENGTTNYLIKMYGNSSGGEFALQPLASTNLFAIPNTNGVNYERTIFSR